MPPEKEESVLCCLLDQWQQRRKKNPTLCYLLQKLKREISQNYKKPKPPILYRNGASSPSSFHREGDETPRYTREAPEL